MLFLCLCLDFNLNYNYWFISSRCCLVCNDTGINVYQSCFYTHPHPSFSSNSSLLVSLVLKLPKVSESQCHLFKSSLQMSSTDRENLFTPEMKWVKVTPALEPNKLHKKINRSLLSLLYNLHTKPTGSTIWLLL